MVKRLAVNQCLMWVRVPLLEPTKGGVIIKTKCLHNKKGLKPESGSSVKLDGEGNCYECDYDPKDNKNCKKFYPIMIQIFEVIDDK